MSPPLYLIGRSNVGKSTAARTLSETGDIRHVDFDALLADQNGGQLTIQAAQDWNAVEPLLQMLEAQSTRPMTVVDIGAGTQDRDRAFGDTKLEDWLKERAERVIWIEGDHDALFKRSTAHRGNVKRFDELEYSEKRQAMALVAGHCVSFENVDPDESADRLRCAILELPLD